MDNEFNFIQDIRDERFLSLCNDVALGTLELLSDIEFNSIEWNIHLYGVSYGLWMSTCDLEYVELEDISDLLNEIVLTHLN